MKVLVTGCAGFIGSHTADLFLSLGYTVIGVDSLTYAGNTSNMELASQNSRFVFYRSDICDTEKIIKYCNDHEVEWIVNFAAETHVDNSITSDAEFVRTNVEGVRSLLECCVKTNSKFLQISTDEVYGSINSGSFVESDSLDPRNPYSATKAAAEHLVTAYGNTFKLQYGIVRMSNNFGPRQHSEKLMPKVFQCLREGKKIPVYGDGKNIRDWFYVKDCARFIEKIVSSNPVNETYNITNEHEIQNIEVIKQACKIAGKEFEDSISFVPDRLGHDFRYSISSSKFKTKFKDFESRTDFNQALTDTMNFYNLE